MIGPRLCLAALLLGAPLARAASPQQQPPAEPPAADDEEPVPPPIPAAHDDLSGHLLLGAGLGAVLPFAELDRRVDFSDRAALGLSFNADAGFGLSRFVAVGGWFGYQSFGAPSGCSACESSSLAVGPMVRYHLVQGTRLDPWASFGVGYRRLRTNDGSGNQTYAGIEWLKLQLGGDWYALSQAAFGPYTELSLGTFTERPSGHRASVYATASFGVRILFDLQGR